MAISESAKKLISANPPSNTGSGLTDKQKNLIQANAPSNYVANQNAPRNYNPNAAIKTAPKSASNAGALAGDNDIGFFQRVANTLSGAFKSSTANYANAGATAYQGGQAGRTARNQELLEEYQYSLSREQKKLDDLIAANKRDPKAFPASDIESQQYIVEDWQRKVTALGGVVDNKVQERATQEAYKAADTLQESAQKDIATAKQGLGKVGQFAVDAGVAGAQMAGDVLAGALIGLPMAAGKGKAALVKNAINLGTNPAMATRIFGAGSAQARQAGATYGQQVSYGALTAAAGILTNKLANTSGVFKTAFGKGLLDDALTKIAAKPLGKLAVSALSEGGEEMLENALDPLLQKITYNPDAAYDAEWLAETLYSGAIGAALGVGGSLASPDTYARPAEQPAANPLAPATGNAPQATTDSAATNAAQSAEFGGQAPYDPIEADAIRKEAKTFRNIIAGIDTSISDFFAKWKDGRKNSQGDKLEKLYLGKMNEEVRQQVSAILGYEVDDRNFIVTNEDVKHIIDEHGNPEKEIRKGNLPLDTWAMDALTSVVTNPDFVTKGKDGKGKNIGKTGVVFTKSFPNGKVVTIQFDNSGRQTMQMTTMYVKNNEDTTLMADAKSPAFTPEATKPVSSIDEDSLAQPAETVNTDDGVGARNNQYKSGQAVSNAKSPWEAGQEVSQEERLYDVTSDEERLNIARQRLELDYNGEKEYLRSAPEWNGEDMNVAHMIQSDLFAEAQKTGDFKEFRDWQKMVKRHSSSFGADLQMLKHWAKRNAESVTSDAASILDEAKEADAASGGKRIISEEMLDAALGDIAFYGARAEALENTGDIEGMYDLVLDAAKHRGYNPSKAVRNALKTCTMEELQDVMWSEIHGIAIDAIPPTLGRQISTYQYLAQLLNAKTLLRNITSNSILAPVEGLFTNNIAAVVDLVSSAVVGKAQGITTQQARTVGFENPLSKAAFAGAKRGIQQSAIDVSLDIGRGNAENKYEVNTNRTFNRYAGDGFWNAVKNIPNTLEGALGYGLNVTDEMQKGATDASVRQSLSKLAGTEGGRITQEMVDDFAKREQLYRSVQRETAIGKLLQGGKDILNTIGIGTSNGKKNWLGLPVKDFGLGDFINKYSRVPGAIATTLIEYTDLGTAKAIYNLYAMTYANKQINAGRSNAEVKSGLSGYEGMTNEEAAVYAQRAFAQNIARVLTGKGLMAAFAGLAKLGILSFTDDEDKDETAVKRSQGLSGLQINLSALGRLLSGESGEMQGQDVLADINSLEPINGLAQIGAELAAMEDGATSKDKLDATAQSVIEGFTDLSMMQNLGSVVDTFSYKGEDETWGETFGKAGLGLLTNTVSGFVPAPVRQAAQFIDPYYRDAYSGSEAEKVGNAAKSPIPVLREQLPTSLTPLGEEREKTTSGALDFFSSFISPFNITRYQQSDVVDEMERTGEYVSRNAPKSVTYKGVTTELNQEQSRKYLVSRGAALNTTVSGLMGAHSYRNAGEAAQKEMMADAREYANAVAKASITGDKSVAEWVINARNSGNPQAYIQYKHFADGETSQIATAKALERVAGISDKERGKIWSQERNKENKESTEAKNPFTGALPQAGISTNVAVDILAEYSAIDKKEIKVRDKAKQFKSYVYSLGLSAKQIDAVAETYKYWGSYPVEW